MSRVTSSRMGVPSANQPSKFRGFRRKHWTVCGPARDAHFARLAAGLPVMPMLTRTWRQGEPVVEFGRGAFVMGATRYVRHTTLGYVRA